MDEALTQLGVGAVIAILIIREVLAFLKTRNGNGHKTDISPECIRTISRIEIDLGKARHSLNNNLTVINGSYHQIKELRNEVRELKAILRRQAQGNDLFDEYNDTD